MLVTNAKKQLEKFGKVETDGHGLYWAERCGYVVSFRVNGREEPGATITNTRVRRVNDHDDGQSDYFAGVFTQNLTRAIRYGLKWGDELQTIDARPVPDRLLADVLAA